MHAAVRTCLLLITLSRQALGTTLRPELIYCNGRRDEAASYELRAVVCYYGSHYASFARTDEAAAFSFAEPTCVPASLRACVL
jgi:hypothetical protein